MSPQEQAAGFLEHSARLVAEYEALTARQRETLRFDFGFLPAPLPLAAAAGMRLNEWTLHSWDVRVALDADATVPEAAAQLLVEHLAGDLGFMTGFVGKADALGKPVTLQGRGQPHRSRHRRRGRPHRGRDEPDCDVCRTARCARPARRGEAHACAHARRVEVIGDVTLDELRKVFPGC